MKLKHKIKENFIAGVVFASFLAGALIALIGILQGILIYLTR